MQVEILDTPREFAAVSYLISSAGEYAVIDPTCPYSPELCEASAVKYILLTHCHFDHIFDVQDWVDKTGARVLISENEVDALKDSYINCFMFYSRTQDGYFGKAYGLRDGDIISLGDSEIRYMATPGHTAGSGCYLCENIAFVGDTIFQGGSYGRTDLPTGNMIMLKDSILKLIQIPDETIIFPGHGPSTTIKQYKLDIGR